MNSIPFEYCAFRYFVQWVRYERALHSRMRSHPSPDDIRDSLRYFKVARSFGGLGTDGGVAKSIREELVDVAARQDITPASRVNELAKRFKARFGKFNISAASKLLWLSKPNEYLVYDSRAVAGLKRLGLSPQARDYAAYEKAWRQKYSESKDSVIRATNRLPEVKAWLPCGPDDSNEMHSISNQKWFLERVFDIYLWELSAA